MLVYPNINPILIQIGPIKIHWYGLMYLLAFLSAWWLGRSRARQPGAAVNEQQLGDLIFYCALGVVLGGRIGYILFYNFAEYLSNPLEILKIWQGGMSFHGGLIGVLIAVGWHGRSIGKSFFELSDFIAPLIPPGLLFGRIGNFINGELWGKPTDLPWGMVFPHADALPRHPTQLYEAALEGLVLFALLWWFSAKPRPRMAVSGLFLAGYAVFRFLVELLRLPDAHIGYLAFNWLTLGQILTLPMFLAGLILMRLAYRRTGAADTP
jgi:phosphatidylglycerol:prolipoprotein diacylglycerol transferase